MVHTPENWSVQISELWFMVLVVVGGGGMGGGRMVYITVTHPTTLICSLLSPGVSELD